MKRTFRVATVFTGAAACAVGLAPPAAEAAPVAPGATARITPDITVRDCTGPNNTSSVHLYYRASENHVPAACFRSSGSYFWGTGKKFASYCGGAFSGYLFIDGEGRHFTAGSSYHYLYGASVSGIRITRHTSSAPCRAYGP